MQRRYVLIEEGDNRNRVELIASGEIDEGHLEAMEGFIRRQRKRLSQQTQSEANTGSVT